MDWIKEILKRLFEAIGAYEPKARFTIMLLLSISLLVPYAMYGYFKNQGEIKDNSIKICNESYLTYQQNCDKKVQELNDKLMNEIKDNKNEITNLLKEVYFIKSQIRNK